MKNVEDIYREMLAQYGEKTGLEPREGCDLSVRLYTMAAQVWGLYVQTEWLVRQCFPQTAQGEHLDRHGQMRGVIRKPAACAVGAVTFSAGEPVKTPLTIPAGTVCMTAGLVRFETLADCTIAGGRTTAEAAVRAAEPGLSGNVPAGAITLMAVAPAGVAACVNGAPCTGGADREEDEALRARILDTFRRLPNGANAAYYEQEALSFEEVAGAAVIPRPRGVGTVDVVVAGRSGLPSAELLEKLTAHFRERREIAVNVKVRAPGQVKLTLAVRITPKPGWDGQRVCRQVEEKLRGFFTGDRLGKPVLRAQLGDLIYRCDGVENYSIQSPAADVALERDQLPVLNSVQVEVKA